MLNLNKWFEIRLLWLIVAAIAYVATGIFTAAALVACSIVSPLCHRFAMKPKDVDDECANEVVGRSS